MMAAVPVRTPAAAQARPVYELRNVSKTYARGKIQALDSVDLTLTEGGFASVIGASGCGKSTLLKIMAGLVPPSSGSVDAGGQTGHGPRAATSA